MKVLERRERIEGAGGAAVFVAHDERERLRDGYLRGLDVPLPVLLDLEREAYRAWGLGRASWLTVYADPQVWRRYAGMLLHRERLRRPGRDARQLGGDFVVAPDGTIAYARPQQRDDRPPVAELLRAVGDAAERSGTASG